MNTFIIDLLTFSKESYVRFLREILILNSTLFEILDFFFKKFCFILIMASKQWSRKFSFLE